MVGDHDLRFAMKARDAQEDLVAEVRVTLDRDPFVGVQRAGLVEDGIRDADLAHVVEEP